MKKLLVFLLGPIFLIGCGKADILGSETTSSCLQNNDGFIESTETVCGEMNGERTTFLNRCFAEEAGAKNIKEGWCDE